MKYLFLLVSLHFGIIAHSQNQINDDTIVIVNGEKIPIKTCVEVNTKILGNSVEPVAFCKCVIPKLFEALKNDSANFARLKSGNWYALFKTKKEFLAQYYQECMSMAGTNDTSAKLTITPRMAEKMKKNMKEQMAGTDVEKTNDIDKFCDCIISGLQTDFSAKEVMSVNINETEKYQKLQEKCLKQTKKK